MNTVAIQAHYSFRLDHLLFMYPDLLCIEEYGTYQILIELKLEPLSPIQSKIKHNSNGAKLRLMVAWDALTTHVHRVPDDRRGDRSPSIIAP